MPHSVTRDQDDPETVEKRLANAMVELSQYREFDYLIVNDDFDVALNDLKQIVNGEGDTYRRDQALPQLQQLLADLRLS